jgi:Na+/phosphate symporter
LNYFQTKFFQAITDTSRVHFFRGLLLTQFCHHFTELEHIRNFSIASPIIDAGINIILYATAFLATTGTAVIASNNTSAVAAFAAISLFVFWVVGAHLDIPIFGCQL